MEEQTRKTFQFPTGIVLIQKDTFKEQPVIAAVIAGYVVILPYATRERRNDAFEKFDRRNAEVIYRSLEALLSEYEEAPLPPVLND